MLCHIFLSHFLTQSELATASLSLAHSLQNLLFCLRDMRPVDTLSPSTDGTSQESVQFVSNEMRAVWNEGLGHPIPEVWMEEERRPFDITSIYFLVCDMLVYVLLVSVCLFHI